MQRLSAPTHIWLAHIFPGAAYLHAGTTALILFCSPHTPDIHDWRLFGVFLPLLLGTVARILSKTTVTVWMHEQKLYVGDPFKLICIPFDRIESVGTFGSPNSGVLTLSFKDNTVFGREVLFGVFDWPMHEKKMQILTMLQSRVEAPNIKLADDAKQ